MIYGGRYKEMLPGLVSVEARDLDEVVSLALNDRMAVVGSAARGPAGRGNDYRPARRPWNDRSAPRRAERADQGHEGLGDPT